MKSVTRFRYLVLAVLMAASHVALVSHVTAHFEPEWEECELCVSQAQPLAAIPMAAPPLPADDGVEKIRFEFRSGWFRTHTRHAYCQRAPPLTFS